MTCSRPLHLRTKPQEGEKKSLPGLFPKYSSFFHLPGWCLFFFITTFPNSILFSFYRLCYCSIFFQSYLTFMTNFFSIFLLVILLFVFTFFSCFSLFFLIFPYFFAFEFVSASCVIPSVNSGNVRAGSL